MFGRDIDFRRTTACVFVAFLTFFAGYATRQPNRVPCYQKNSATNQPLLSSTTHSDQTSSDNSQNTHDISPTGNTSIERAQWALVWVTGAMVLFIGWQAFETRKSADAAVASTQILVASERAWINVGLKRMPKVDSNAGVAIVIPIVKNYGKTVGRVTGFSIQCQQVRSPGDLPPEPTYARPVTTSQILPPNIPLRPMSVNITKETIQQAEDLHLCIYVYGYIDYLIFEKEKKRARFCYMYYPEHALFGPLKPGFYVGLQAPEAYKAST
jgi:hypothetical protein